MGVKPALKNELRDRELERKTKGWLAGSEIAIYRVM